MRLRLQFLFFLCWSGCKVIKLQRHNVTAFRSAYPQDTVWAETRRSTGTYSCSTANCGCWSGFGTTAKRSCWPTAGSRSGITTASRLKTWRLAAGSGIKISAYNCSIWYESVAKPSDLWYSFCEPLGPLLYLMIFRQLSFYRSPNGLSIAYLLLRT